jgi:hypothetical protein
MTQPELDNAVALLPYAPCAALASAQEELDRRISPVLLLWQNVSESTRDAWRVWLFYARAHEEWIRRCE